ELARVPGRNRLPVLALPVFASLTCGLGGAVEGLLDRSLILGGPPLATLLHFADDAVGDHAASPFGLRRPGGALVAVAGRPPGRPLRGPLRGALVLGLPPHAQHLRLAGRTVEGVPPGVVVLGLPPRPQPQHFTLGTLLRFADLTFVLVRPPLSQLSELELG